MSSKVRKTILVVCRGNIIRSPFAEAIINQEIIRHGLEKSVVAISRGIQGTGIDPKPVKFPNITFYDQEYRLSKPSLDRFNVDLSRHESKPIDIKVVRQADIILAVDSKVQNALCELFPNFKTKIIRISELTATKQDFTDPVIFNKPSEYLKILSAINDTITNGFDNLLRIIGEEPNS